MIKRFGSSSVFFCCVFVFPLLFSDKTICKNSTNGNRARMNSRAVVAISRYSFYTWEKQGNLLVSFPKRMQGRSVSLDLFCEGHPVVENFRTEAVERVFVPFPLDSLKYGMNDVVCYYRLSKERMDTLHVPVTKWPPKFNEVKIDHATGGLIVEGLPFFPFGFYCYSPVQPTLAEEEVVNGFNVMSPYQRIERRSRRARLRYMDRCAELGMKVHYNLLSVAGGGGVGSGRTEDKTAGEKRRLLEQEVKTFRDHPALLAWYISDEPVGHGVSVDDLVETYQTIKALDPYHPVTIVFMTPRKATEYAAVMDIVMADPYPIPDGSVTEVTEVTRGLKSDFGTNKPIWIIPQAFGGNEWWQREPTAHELRVMTYLAVIDGATGIQYFIRHGLSSFPKSPVAWSECGAVAREIAELTPYLLSDEFSPEVFCSRREVAFNAWRHKGGIVLLVANTENRPLSVQFRLKDISFTGQGDVLFENRKIGVAGGEIEDTIDGMGTRAYMITVAHTDEKGQEIRQNSLIVNPSFENNHNVGTPAGCYVRSGDDRGATFFVDSRVAFHGNHSLRLNTPREGEGVSLAFFPVQLNEGDTYCFTIWAKGPEGLLHRPTNGYRRFFQRLFPWVREKEKKLKFEMSLGDLNSREFVLTPEWQKYFVSARVINNRNNNGRVSSRLRLISQGKAWFDLMQVVIDPKIQSEIIDSKRAVKITLYTEHEGAQIRYTLDGNEPSANSPIYGEPLLMEKSGVIKAGVFKQDELIGVSERSFQIHAAFGERIKYNTRYSPKFSGGGDMSLVDGLTGSTSYRDGFWQGFLKEDMDVSIDLGRVMPIQEITTHFLQDISVWLFLPISVEYGVSTDGKNFHSIAKLKNEIPSTKRGAFVQAFSGWRENVTARYVRVRARNIRTCPAWHRGAGGEAWIFVDEIVVN